MKKTLVDTGHWVGAFYDKDNWNKEGKRFLKWFGEQDGEKSRIIITYGILTEIIARLINKTGFNRANKVLNFILESDKIDIYNESKKYQGEIFEMFETYEDFSLVDSEIIVIYLTLGCDQLVSIAKEFKRVPRIDYFRNPQ